MSEIKAGEECSTCQQPLHDSLAIQKNGKAFKSCPLCSSKAGKHVFYKYDDFGIRNTEILVMVD